MYKTITNLKNSKTTILVLIGVGTIIAFLVIAFTIGKYNPDPNSQVIQELLSKMLSDEKSKYEQIINKKDMEINKINNQLNNSMVIITNNEKEIVKLKNKISSIKPPVNELEIRTRLKDLGYETY